MRLPLAVNLIVAAFLLLCCGACGYHLEGQPSSAKRQRLYVELFANDTHRAFANDLLTSQVIERFARSPHFVIVEDPALADLVVGGVITLYDTSPIAYSRYDSISAYRVDLTVRALLQRPAAERKVVWRETLSTSQDYIGNNPDLVIPKCAERLASELYVQVTDLLFWDGERRGK